MKRHPITLERPERFSDVPVISREKIDRAIAVAAERLERMGTRHGLDFPGTSASDMKYQYGPNNNWGCGMYVGCYWLAWQLTGVGFFKKRAVELSETFAERLEKKVGMDDHDIGFEFIPSTLAYHKLIGVKDAKRITLGAAEYFYEKSYSKEGRFIIRNWKNWDSGNGCRTMMDSLMNAPLLYWAAGATGNEEYFKAAHDHVKTTEEYLIRADSSSYHHYQFDPKTAKPVRGLTFQGHRDESCWSRGHAWGICGLPIAYSYDKCDFIKDLHKDITYFMLNHLPEDFIPYWDYDFVDGDEPRDSSAGVISACGLFEMARNLDDTDINKTIFNSAATQILEATIDRCTDGIGEDDDGLITDVTANLPKGKGIAQSAVYGDFFYLEALARYINPYFKMYW